jgi:phosphoglycolate phosphatase-like HAD superfamily hydrolase
MHSRDDLLSLRPCHGSLVGVDSDGCVFDTMELKQKRCFHPRIIEHWGLQAVAAPVRAVAEFLNLYSRWRGQNRFVTLVMTFDMLREHPAVLAAGQAVPELRATRAWVESGATLSNATLERAAAETGDPELASVLRWSLAVNRDVADVARHVPMFAWAREGLERMAASSDVLCVSQTPTEALEREWAEHDIARLVRGIAGQELGTKAEHLSMASSGRYARDRMLMVGDALGDLQAARAVGALFYPINPGAETASWERLLREGYDRFLAGTFAGDYQAGLIAEFDARLPSIPPWTCAT